MLVRDNTKCPFCGRESATDIYFPHQVPLSSDSLTFRAECSECLGFKETAVPVWVVRCWIQSLAKSSGSVVYLGAPCRWNNTFLGFYSREQYNAIVAAAEKYFESGFVLSRNAAELSIYRGICRALKTSVGLDLNEAMLQFNRVLASL